MHYAAMLKRIVQGILIALFFGIVAIFVWPEKSYEPYAVDAAYQAQVDAFVLPGVPPDWEWKSFTAKDGTKLRWGETGNKDAAKASLIWVPGYTATLDMYGEHFDDFARRGYHVIGLDLRGQGGSERHREHQPEKMWVKDFATYSDDLAAFIQSLPKREDRPLILSGASFGGHVATRTVGDHTLPVHGLYLIAPALRPESAPYTFEQAKGLMQISNLIGKSKHYVYGQKDWRPDGLDYTQGSDCSSNPKRLYLRDAVFTRKPEQRVGGITNQYGLEFFKSSEYLLSEGYLEKLTLPVSIISATNDTFVVTDYNSRACRDQMLDCREVTPPNTGHCLSQESDAVLETMYDEMDALLERINAR